VTMDGRKVVESLGSQFFVLTINKLFAKGSNIERTIFFYFVGLVGVKGQLKISVGEWGKWEEKRRPHTEQFIQWTCEGVHARSSYRSIYPVSHQILRPGEWGQRLSARCEALGCHRWF